jgi:hypothetical protein
LVFERHVAVRESDFFVQEAQSGDELLGIRPRFVLLKRTARFNARKQIAAFEERHNKAALHEAKARLESKKGALDAVEIKALDAKLRLLQATRPLVKTEEFDKLVLSNMADDTKRYPYDKCNTRELEALVRKDPAGNTAARYVLAVESLKTAHRQMQFLKPIAAADLLNKAIQGPDGFVDAWGSDEPKHSRTRLKTRMCTPKTQTKTTTMKTRTRIQKLCVSTHFV